MSFFTGQQNVRGAQSMGNMMRDEDYKFPKQPRSKECPPSYETVLDEDFGSMNITPKQIIKEIVQFKGCWCKIDSLCALLRQPESSVLGVIKSYPDLFSCMKPTSGEVLIELTPKVRLCKEYKNEDGCKNSDCNDLHICENFVAKQCMKGHGCLLGHGYKTNHNMKALLKCHLEDLNDDQLCDVFAKTLQINVPIICFHYNKQECTRRENCLRLHICFRQVMSLGNCTIPNCKLNHNIFNKQCVGVLTKFGISTNETPRDLIKLLKDHQVNKNERNPSLKTERETPKKGSSNPKAAGKMKNDSEKPHLSTKPKANPKKEKKGQNIDKSKMTEELNPSKPDNLKKQDSAKAKTIGSNKKEKSEDSKGNFNKKNNQKLDSNKPSSSFKPKPIKKTEKMSKDKECKMEKPNKIVCKNDLCGNSAFPYICLNGIENNCLNDSCPYFHSDIPYQWQINHKKLGWLNLTEEMSKSLEEKFCDPYCEEQMINGINSKCIPHVMLDLLCHLGKGECIASFINMTLWSSSTKLLYPLRRISTKSSVELPIAPLSTKFMWYCKDSLRGWVDFEENEKELEEAYISGVDTIAITVNLDKWIVNFKEMSQTSLGPVKVVKRIARRPFGTVRDVKNIEGFLKLPTNWKQMNPIKKYELVLLKENQEFQNVASKIRLTMPICTILEIFRIQNSTLWKSFKSRQFQYKKLNHSNVDLNIQELFHELALTHIDDICAYNIDGHIHEMNNNKPFGMGTYFYNSAALVSKRCTPLPDGSKRMLLAQVNLGSVIVKGTPGLNTLPVHPTLKKVADTVVDDVTLPTIFIKQSKDDYYPSYIISFKDGFHM